VRRNAMSVLIGLLVFAQCNSIGWAQATAQISGAARDQSGAVLPGVEITVTHTDTGVTRNAVTNETGSYVLPNLAVGPYKLEAALPGFRTYVQTGIVLQVNGSPTINVTLEVGQVAETVEVQANAAAVETRSSTVGSVIENERILELPLNGRNVTDLIALAGGAVRQAATSNNFSVGESPSLAIAGGAAFGVDFALDGANHVNFMSGTAMTMPFPDAMQEFKVENGGVGAQSRNSSSVSAVTKSGTNQFHGDLFEFVRNDLFNATTYFAAVNPVTGQKVRSTLKRNQFGGTAGGAIVKNKLFFFGGYQGTTIRSDPQDNRTFIPTAAMLAGDWTAFASPQCNAGRQITLRAPFVNNRIDPTLYSKAALFVVNYNGAKPFPKTNDPCGAFTYGNKSSENDATYVGKVDYQKSDKHSLFGRLLITTAHIPNQWDWNTNLLQDTGYRNGIAESLTLGSTYLVSANTVQSLRLAVNRNYTYYYNIEKGQLFNWCDAGVKIYCAPEITRPIVNAITGAFSLTSGFLTGHKYAGTMFSVDDDVSLVRGTHQISLGFGARYGKQANLSPYVSAHQFTFNGGTTGLGLADFMTGKPSQLMTARTNPHHLNGTFLGAYAGDSWKATSRLTLNYGVRWDPALAPWVEAVYNFDYARFQQGIKSSVFVNEPAGLYYRGDPGFPKNGVNNQWLHFSPRLGFAWDVSGDGHTSVRASYSLGYVQVPGDFRERYSGTGPWGARITLSNPVGGLDDPYQGVPGGDIFNGYVIDKNVPVPPYGWIYSQPYDMPPTYSQSWNVSIQRQLATEWLLTATYMGSNLVHVWGNQSINPGIYIPGGPCTINGVSYNPCSSLSNVDQRRKFSLERPADGAKIGFAAEGEAGGVQSYQGVLLSIARRAAKGVTVNANYTLSHCIGPYATLYDARFLWPYQTYTVLDNRRADRGNCDSDRRQVFNLTSVAAMPQFANRTLRLVASGWQLSGIYTRSAGTPINLTSGSDRALTGISDQRPNQIGGNPFLDTSGAGNSRFLNSAAFELPAIGTPAGNVGRNTVRGPAAWSFDMSLSRRFNVREMQRMEFRAEAFNLTNSFRPQAPSGNFGSNTFGVIRTSDLPRVLQFALKYFF